MAYPGPSLPPQARAFVAAPLPPELLERIERVRRPWLGEPGSTDVRWTHPDQMHLTLRFFGNVPISDLGDLEGALQRAVQTHPALRLSVTGLGCFPSPRQPRVIWLGVEGDLPGLRELQARVEQATRRFGSHSEAREFHPHLTLGRVRALGAAARRIGERVEATAVGELGSWLFRELLLMKSELSPCGSVYEILARAPLASPAGPAPLDKNP